MAASGSTLYMAANIAATRVRETTKIEAPKRHLKKWKDTMEEGSQSGKRGADGKRYCEHKAEGNHQTQAR